MVNTRNLIQNSNYHNELIEIILGLILSSGYINLIKFNSNYKMEFTFNIINKKGKNIIDFYKWLQFTILKDILTTIPLNLYPKCKPTIFIFNLNSLPFLTELYNLFFCINNQNKKIKIIPDNKFLNLYFTPRALAFMLMGDGYWDNDHKTVYICTESFTLNDLHRLIFILRHKYHLILSTSKCKDNFRIRFSSKELNIRLLRTLVLPYFHPILLYKLGLNYKTL